MPPRGLIALIALFAHVFFEGARVGPPRSPHYPLVRHRSTGRRPDKNTEPEASREKPNECAKCALISHFPKTPALGKASAASGIQGKAEKSRCNEGLSTYPGVSTLSESKRMLSHDENLFVFCFVSGHDFSRAVKVQK